MEPGWRPGDYDEEQVDEALWEVARYYEHVVSGGLIQPVDTDVLLTPDEWAYADEMMEYARYYRTQAFQERPDSYLSPTDVLGSVIRNRISRDSAAPQWRDPFSARVVITDKRILVAREDHWLSFWYEGIAEFDPYPADFRLVLTFHDTEPMRLRGPTVPFRSILVASFLYPPEEMAHIPGFAPLVQ